LGRRQSRRCFARLDRDPGSIYYVAANVEENDQRTRRYGNKQVYAYEWLRYHDSNKKLAGQEFSGRVIRTA
jgi:hypothetical protein